MPFSPRHTHEDVSPSRPTVEKWDREELEDRFHQLANQLYGMKRERNRLERELKM